MVSERGLIIMARRRGKKIDFVHWTGFFGNQFALGAGTAANTLFSAQHDPETLMRLRGHLTVWVDGLEIPAVAARVSVGIIPVPEGTGTTVLWSPETDIDAPWMWHSIFDLGYEEYVTDVIDAPQLTVHKEVIDNKAMRILRNQELQLVWENVTISGALAFNGGCYGRGLFGK